MEFNKDIAGVKFITDDTGRITGYTTEKGGADTVFPFKSYYKIASGACGSIETNISELFSNYSDLTEENFLLVPENGTISSSVSGTTQDGIISRYKSELAYDPTTGLLTTRAYLFLWVGRLLAVKEQDVTYSIFAVLG